MEIVPQNKRYLPHEFKTKIHAVRYYRTYGDISHTCRKYHISKASLMRWNKQYDGTDESLTPKSHRPHTPHPNIHTEQEVKWIMDIYHRNPNISTCEMYGKLLRKGYTRHPGSLYRVMQRLGIIKKAESMKKKSKHLGTYVTPGYPGMKWQMDVKFVPRACYVGGTDDRFFQYTMIDEATRERFIYPYLEQSNYSTVDFINRAIKYFGYKPDIIQTDNGTEFTYFKKATRMHNMDILCNELLIVHKLIRPRTPWHNGKVERSHRNDQERFYNHLSFYSYEDLKIQMAAYMRRSNRIPMAVLGWKTPVEKRQELQLKKLALLGGLFQESVGATPLLLPEKIA